MRKLWKALLFLVVIASASAAVYALSRSGKKGNDGPKLVDVTTGSIVEKAVAVGQIQPRQKFQVKSKISGIVKRALVQVGDTVNAGDPLFEIGPDPTPLEVTEVDRQVDSSDASYRRAQTDYQRSVELSRSGVLPKSDLEQQKEGATLFDVEVELDPTTKITLRAGYSANADVIIREKKDVLVIPERLVTFEDGGKKATVELAGPTTKAPTKKVEIKTGISDG